MKIKRIINFIIFLLYTWLILNSLLFAIGVTFYEIATPERCLNYFLIFIIQMPAPIFIIIYETPIAIIDYIKYGSSDVYSIIIYYIIFINIGAILFYPCRLWFRKKTVFRAWLVAMTGSLMPQYIFLIFEKGLEYYMYALPVMTMGYALLWLALRVARKRLSRYKDASA